MKTTSYEISKKLAEIGFKADAIFAWRKTDGELLGYPHHINGEEMVLKHYYLAYDLETILDALPESILDKKTASFKEFLTLRTDGIFYECDLTVDHIGVEREGNESLADTAARLLLKLVEKGILTFKK